MSNLPADKVSEIDRIPALPQVMQRVLDVMSNPRSSAREITEEIAQDPALTSRLLKIVNSAYYGLGRQVSTLSQAIVLLGFTQVRSLVVASAMQDIWKTSNDSDTRRRESLWKHCLGTAIIAKEIGRWLEYSQQEEMFIGGLLHDIGKIIMDCFWHEDYEAIVEVIQERSCSFDQAEQTRSSDIDHVKIGAMVAKQWNLPQLFIHIITFHHSPSKSESHMLEASIVHVANLIARVKEIGDGGDGNILTCIEGEAWERLQISDEDIPKLMAVIDTRLDNEVLLQEAGIW